MTARARSTARSLRHLIRVGTAPRDVVTRIVIVFDEGQDPSGGPDQFGAAILDNIDVNGTLVGHGAVNAN